MSTGIVRRLCVVMLACGALTGTAAAQTASDVQGGKALFDGLCVTCHGFEGTGGVGPPLTRPKLLSAPDDAALRAVISEGIPDRGMPRIRRTTENELRQLVAYVRSLGQRAVAPVKGDAARGAGIYAAQGCASCHIISGQGGSFGPALSDIGWLRGAQHLRQAVVDPGALLPRGTLPIPARGYQEYLPVRIVAADGRVVRGVRLNEDVFSIQVRDQTGRMHSFRKSETKAIQKEEGVSLMPSYATRITGADLDDLVAYLSTLGGTR